MTLRSKEEGQAQAELVNDNIYMLYFEVPLSEALFVEFCGVFLFGKCFF